MYNCRIDDVTCFSSPTSQAGGIRRKAVRQRVLFACVMGTFDHTWWFRVKVIRLCLTRESTVSGDTD